MVVWSEGKHGQNSSVQDVVSYAQEVSDSINGYVKMKVSYGSCQIVKTSEDGKVDGINFTITGNGISVLLFPVMLLTSMQLRTKTVWQLSKVCLSVVLNHISLKK